MDKQNWDQIEKDFNNQWVELVDYEWQEGKPFPNSGKVRVHATDRNEFYKLAKIDPPKDSAILFVGKPDIPANTFLCSSIMQLRNATN
jgi:hypothetical protein